MMKKLTGPLLLSLAVAVVALSPIGSAHAAITPNANATMVALAEHVAGPNIVVECAEIPYAGLAYAWESPARIVIDPGDCDRIQATIYHGLDAYAVDRMIHLRVLLHEAAHIRQYRLGLTDFSQPATVGFNYEHDAECRSIAALPDALGAIGYFPSFINEAVRVEAGAVAQEQAPYGGYCPPVAPLSLPRARHHYR